MFALKRLLAAGGTFLMVDCTLTSHGYILNKAPSKAWNV